MSTKSSASLPHGNPADRQDVSASAYAASANESASHPDDVGAAEEPDNGPPEEDDGDHGGHFVMLTAVPSWLFSMVFHVVVLLLLAMLTMPPPPDDSVQTLEVGRNEEMEELQVFDEPIEMPDVDPEEVDTEMQAMTDSTSEAPTAETIASADDLEAAAVQVDIADFGERTAPKNDLLATVGAVAGQGFQGRGQAERRQMVRAAGGTKGSEGAVARALEWLARHQLPNGAWSFDHTFGPGRRVSPHPGELKEAFNGATAMALLPFLGAGHTHQEGAYQKVVYAGLDFLVKQGMKRENHGGLATGSFEESGGNMYSHGLCSIVLCEAYGMTQDKALLQPAQLAVNHIVYAQDPVGGGWRYRPKQPGDTSVVGWQLMALKSGHMAYLQVPPNTVRGASNFLDLVQSDGGAKYGYTSPGAREANTAVGLLCRMYLGWKREQSALKRGVEWLSDRGPSISSGGTGNMYYNYYATQVLRHYGGEQGDPQWELWEKWNEKMRDTLVSLQAKEGPSAGSWFIRGDHGSEKGGRLYCTSMATMILEVYYRHMPIYQQEAADEEFPL